MKPRCLLALGLLGAALAGRAHADPAADVVAAALRLQDQSSYSWERIDGRPGAVATSGNTQAGNTAGHYAVKVNRTLPNLKGSKRSDGFTVITAELPDGLQSTAIIPRDGPGVASTPDGWVTREEISAGMRNALRDRNLGLTKVLQAAGAALAGRRPDEEISSLANDPVSFTTAGSDIVGELSPKMAAKNFSGANPFMTLQNVKGSVTFQIGSGLIRAYTVQVEATMNFRPPSLPGKTTDGALSGERPSIDDTREITTIISYASPASYLIPVEAKKRLENLKAAAKPVPAAAPKS